MVKIAHAINVTEINESKKSSYLHIAQPTTIRSMIIAQEMAKNIVDVDLIAIKHKDEQVTCPSEFQWAANLEEYACDRIESLKQLDHKKPLPCLGDILINLYNFSDAEYFIYTNLDIGLYPQFYIEVKNIIEQGYDAFFINRRDLPTEYQGILLDENKLEMIFTLKGTTHPGIDCFVFKREIVPSLKLGNVYIGFPPVGQVLKYQIETNANNCMWFKDKLLTFHLGKDNSWKKGGIYQDENRNQASHLYVSCLQKKPSLYSRVEKKLNHWLRSKIHDGEQIICQSRQK